MPKTIVIDIDPGGDTRFVYDDQLRGLMEYDAQIRRASHVEPGNVGLDQDPLAWHADMAPSGGGILGPFTTRAQALEAETAWIKENVLSCPTASRTAGVSGRPGWPSGPRRSARWPSGSRPPACG